ncbi:MAG: hypothetical protein JO213_04230 [Alphaproteobacteria bacterium]|nr:hypothetical protein [Alphaproteobacteria bacterium]
MTSVRKLLIHVGPAKTGTSAVQHVLRQHDNSLIVYPKVGLWADGAHHNLVFNFYGDFGRPEIIREDVGEMLERIGAEARASGRDVLISSEGLIGRDVGALIGSLLAHASPGEWRPEIVFACRDHFERAASLYNQRVKDNVFRERREPDKFLLGHLAELTYAPIAAELRTYGFPSFLDYVGASDLDFVEERRNVSLSRKGLIATLAANHVAESFDERLRYFTALRRLRPFFAPSQFIFGPEAAARAEIQFRQDRQFLAAEFGVALPAPDIDNQPGRFAIDQRDLKDIEEATADLGPAGEAIVAVARRYLRSEPSAA